MNLFTSDAVAWAWRNAVPQETAEAFGRFYAERAALRPWLTYAAAWREFVAGRPDAPTL